MAQNINIGTADNAKDGQTLREAFRRIRKNFAEIWGDTDAANLTDTEDLPSASYDSIITEKIEDTVDAMFSGGTHSNITVTYDDSDGTLDLSVAADITDVNAGNGLTGVNEGGGAATLNVVGGDGITANADEIEATVDDSTIELSASDGTGALRVKDDGITHDKLENRYTARASAVTTSGATTLDWSSAAIFPVTMGGNHTLNFSSYKKGQVVDIIVSGAYTITLGTSTGTPTINQVGDGTYDNSTTNLIQVVCTDDDSTPEFFYSVGTYSSDTNPA